jgi:hypothetical protein
MFECEEVPRKLELAFPATADEEEEFVVECELEDPPPE